jgi:hypothetical protein
MGGKRTKSTTLTFAQCSAVQSTTARLVMPHAANGPFSAGWVGLVAVCYCKHFCEVKTKTKKRNNQFLFFGIPIQFIPIAD